MLSVRHGRALFALAFLLLAGGAVTAFLQEGFVLAGGLAVFACGAVGGGFLVGRVATALPAPAAPAPRSPAPRSLTPPAPLPAPLGAGRPAPLFGGRAAPRELTPLRSTTVASLTAERAEPEPPEPAPHDVPDGERRWGSPAAPGSATQVLPQRRRAVRARATVPAQRVGGRVPVPDPDPTAEPAAQDSRPAQPVPAARPAGKVDLTPRPGDPAVGAALLAPARARLHELEPPLVRSWLTLLDTGQRGEPVPTLKAGQVAVLAAGLEDAAVRRRLLRAVADPLVDAVGLVTQDLPLDGVSAAAAPPGRVDAARDLLLLVARTTTGTPAQGAAVRAVKWLDRPATTG